MGIAAAPIHQAGPALARAVERAFTGRAAPVYELAMPASRTVAGVAMTVHGGGWVWVGPGTLRGCDMHVERWLSRGWATVNVDYRAGGHSITDVLAFHDAIRGWAGTRMPFGIVGVSAGGHLGLMTAAQRRGVNWVVGVGAPTDLVLLGGTTDADNVRRLARESFGASRAALRAASPVTHAPSIDAHVLLATSADDAVVPPAQVHAFVAARPERTSGMVLEGGPREFIHAGVSDAAFARFVRAEEQMLDDVGRASGGAMEDFGASQRRASS
jgi:acetyl esterase/lipase